MSTKYITWTTLVLTLTGCEVGLTTDGIKIGEDSGLEENVDETEEPSGEPSSGEPSSEPTNEPSNENDSTTDDDGDGFSEDLGDCDDTNNAIGPHANEIPGDNVDQNCDQKELCYQDNDQDGYATETIMMSLDLVCGNDSGEAEAGSPTTDCDDNDAGIFPGATEIQNDGVDQDCNGSDDGSLNPDVDGDGYDNTQDCNDYNASVYPGAYDIPGDGIDQDCDGQDASNGPVDSDGDGYNTTTDCNDSDYFINPGAYDIPGDGIDQDCDGQDAGTSNPDIDGDGYDSSTDCNDYNASINPGAYDIPGDGIDQDCDGQDAQSTGCMSTEMLDCNGVCAPLANYGDGTCDSGTLSWNGQIVDYNCGTLFYENGDCSVTDIDGDGYDASVDCNDYNASINPGAYDIPGDGIDQDCDGQDAGSTGGCTSTETLDCLGQCAPTQWLGDGTCDSGTFGYAGIYVDFDCALHSYDNGDCSSTSVDNDFDGYDASVDCDDSDYFINPGAYDIPGDGIDQDCDGQDAGTTPLSYTGSENFKYGEATFFNGYYDCDMNFTLSGVPSTVPCSTCDYVFDMTISYSSGTYNSTCSPLATTMVVPYGFVSNHNGTGEQALLLYENGAWVEFAVNNNTSINMLDTVQFTSTTFSYSAGYLDFYTYYNYASGYFSNRWSGSGSN